MNRKRTLQGELERVTKQIDKLVKAIIDGLMDEILFVQLKLRSRLGDLLCSFSNDLLDGLGCQRPAQSLLALKLRN